MRITKLLLPSLLASLTACAADEDQPPTSTSESALTYNSLWWVSCGPGDPACGTQNPGIGFSDVKVADEICVLAGLSGDFRYTGDNEPGVEIYDGGELWKATLHRSFIDYPHMAAGVECFNSTQGNLVKELTWKTGDRNTSLNMIPAGDLQCFLSSVHNTSTDGFTDYNDIVQVHKDGGQWVLDGKSLHGAKLSASARCFSGVRVIGSGAADDSTQSGQVIAPDGHNTACAITMIGGKLNTGSVSGASIGWTSSPNQFTVNKDPHTQLGWSCFQ